MDREKKWHQINSGGDAKWGGVGRNCKRLMVEEEGGKQIWLVETKLLVWRAWTANQS